MKNFTLLIFIGFPFLFFSQTESGLSFETTSHDFGAVSKDTKIEATFFFTNTSDLPVEILKIHGQNHCIEIDSSSLKVYDPKEKGLVTVNYNSNCMGPIRKTLSVFTSVENNTISLKLTGKVVD